MSSFLMTMMTIMMMMHHAANRMLMTDARQEDQRWVNLRLGNYPWPPLSFHALPLTECIAEHNKDTCAGNCFPSSLPVSLSLSSSQTSSLSVLDNFFSSSPLSITPFFPLILPPPRLFLSSLALSPPPLCLSQMKWLILSFPLPVAPLTSWKGRATLSCPPLTMDVLFWQRQTERKRERPCRLWRG